MRGSRVVVLIVVAGLVLVGVGAAVVSRVFMRGAEPQTEAPTQEQETPAVEVQNTDVAPQPVAQTYGEFEQNVRSGEYASIRLIGDSITAGYGTDDYFEVPGQVVVYDDGAGEVQIEESLSARCWGNEFRRWAEARGVRSFVNAGLSGWFMQQFGEKPQAWLMGGADVVVVALGTNDAGYIGPEEFRASAEAGLAAAAAQSKLVVVLAPVLDLRSQGMLVESTSELGDILQEICNANGYVFVDPRAAVTPDMFCEDGLHPNSTGSHAIWECLRSTLNMT